MQTIQVILTGTYCESETSVLAICGEKELFNERFPRREVAYQVATALAESYRRMGFEVDFVVDIHDIVRDVIKELQRRG